ncbi:uncharacterized protein RCH25_049052 [Pelodytes ibericus]
MEWKKAFSSNPPWLKIEQTQTHTADLYQICWMPQILFKKLEITSRILKDLMGTLYRTKKALGIDDALSKRAPIQVVSLCVADLNLQHWRDKGIHCIGDLYNDEHLSQFSDLNRTFNLDASQIFTYLRVKSFLATHPPADHPRWDAFLEAPPSKNQVSTIQRLLESFVQRGKSRATLQWEKDIGQSFPYEVWCMAWGETRKASHCVNIQEQFYKLTNRWYLVPTRLAKFSTDGNDFCWRCYEQKAGCFGVPLAADKTEGPRTCLSFLGLEIDSLAGECRLPQDKLAALRDGVAEMQRAKKVTLRQMQSLLGRLNFASRVIPMGRVFSRSLSRATAGVLAPHHLIRITKPLREDLEIWDTFLLHFNGKVFFRKAMVSSQDLNLFTDASGSVSFGAYFGGKWCAEKWPEEWKSCPLIRNLAFLEMFPVVVALALWGDRLKDRRVVFYSDNQAVVEAINGLSASSMPVIRLLRRLVLLCMSLNIAFRARHVPGYLNVIADSLSRLQFSRFRLVAPEAEEVGVRCPEEMWKLGTSCLHIG